MQVRPKSFHVGTDSEVLPVLLSVHCAASDPRILDCTANEGRMWRDTGYHPLRLDLDPAVRPQVVGDFRALPFAAASFDVLVFDPPHLPNAGAVLEDYASAYGLTDDPTRTGYNINAYFAPFLAEARRVLRPNGIILAKIADLVHNHTYQWQHVAFITEAQVAQLTPCDLLVKADPSAGHLQSSQWEQVYHLRKVHCYWIVVRKGACECPSNVIPARPRNRAVQLGLALEVA